MEREKILSRIAQLPKLPIVELKNMWVELFEKPAPAFNRNYLEARIAYRLQELAFGGISDDTMGRVKKMVEAKFNKRAGRKALQPPIGTVLIREFKGVEYRVRVLADGFEYEGMKYRSLTAVALKITGISWSGVVFFGLKTNRVHIS